MVFTYLSLTIKFKKIGSSILKRKIKLKFFSYAFFLVLCIIAVFFSPLKSVLTAEKITEFMSGFEKQSFAIPVFIAITSIGVWAMVPTFIFIVASGLIFGHFQGALFSMAGINLGFFLAFISGKTFLHSFVSHHIQNKQYLKKLDNHAANNPVFFVIISRLLFVIPWNVFNYAVSISSVKTRHFMIGSFIGTIPGSLIYSFFGSSMKGGSKNSSPLIISSLIILTMVSIALFLKKKVFKNKA